MFQSIACIHFMIIIIKSSTWWFYRQPCWQIPFKSCETVHVAGEVFFWYRWQNEIDWSEWQLETLIEKVNCMAEWMFAMPKLSQSDHYRFTFNSQTQQTVYLPFYTVSFWADSATVINIDCFIFRFKIAQNIFSLSSVHRRLVSHRKVHLRMKFAAVTVAIDLMIYLFSSRKIYCCLATFGCSVSFSRLNRLQSKSILRAGTSRRRAHNHFVSRFIFVFFFSFRSLLISRCGSISFFFIFLFVVLFAVHFAVDGTHDLHANQQTKEKRRDAKRREEKRSAKCALVCLLPARDRSRSFLFRSIRSCRGRRRRRCILCLVETYLHSLIIENCVRVERFVRVHVALCPCACCLLFGHSVAANGLTFARTCARARSRLTHWVIMCQTRFWSIDEKSSAIAKCERKTKKKHEIYPKFAFRRSDDWRAMATAQKKKNKLANRLIKCTREMQRRECVRERERKKSENWKRAERRKYNRSATTTVCCLRRAF